MRWLVWAVLAAGSAACRIEFGAPAVSGVVGSSLDAPAGEVWIYTSMYPVVIDAMEAALAAKHPDITPRWYQAGSEKVAQRAEAEWSSGSTMACLLLTSDPFWYVRLKGQDRLVPYLSPEVLKIDRSLVDPDGAWVTARLSLAVLGVHDKGGAKADEPPPPEAFSDLVDPVYRDLLTMGDPLASGSTFTWLAFVLDDPGPGYLKGLRDNRIVAAGGSSAVLTRLQTAERRVGVLLLENLLTTEPTAVRAVFPEDGAVLVPGPIALTKDCPNPVAARAVYDLILSPEGQGVLAAGDMYSVLPGVPPPEGAPALDTIAVRPWKPGFVDDIVARQSEIKDQWAAR